ncbi:MAG: hydrogenase maturation protease [Saprospiraceae bacterium]|nr:hydrogenase maturation protease [Saprospiraceae bacterium]
MKHVAFQNISVDDRTLWIGIGNTGRSDDGLGWAFVDRLTKEGIPGQKVCRYQLQIEDADLLRAHDRIIFVDASHEALPDGFVVHWIGPRDEVAFTTHALPPESVLALCRDVYGHNPRAWLLAIEGVNWDLGEGLSSTAIQNLESAVSVFQTTLVD